MRKARIRVLTPEGVSDVELDLHPGAGSPCGDQDADGRPGQPDPLLALPGVRRVVSRLRAEAERDAPARL